MKTDDPECLAQLFDLAEQTVASRADWMPNREEARQSYRGTLEHFFGETDDGFFQTHASVIFFSGLKVSTVEPKLQAIRDAFRDIYTVSAYCDERIDALMGNPDLIRNKAKITAVVRNARSFQAIISRHGSFRASLLSFNEGFPKGRQSCLHVAMLRLLFRPAV
ncbi:MAG: DNA-3-methyladenine glycosylase I [Firmicutes bacterium]|nr:DNA-3-methyladenine glycosylase I [Bacillota bacterium]